MGDLREGGGMSSPLSQGWVGESAHHSMIILLRQNMAPDVTTQEQEPFLRMQGSFLCQHVMGESLADAGND